MFAVQQHRYYANISTRRDYLASDAPWLLRAAEQFCDGRVTLRSYSCWKSIYTYRHASVVTINYKMLIYRRETALQGAL